MILLIWLLSLAHGILFIVSTPQWEGFDEPFHYAYVQNLAEHGQIPVYGKTLISEEITASFRVLPLSPPVNANLGNRYTSFGDYFHLPVTIQREREIALRSIPRTARRIPDTSAEACLNYEAQHPPLYYLLCAGIYRLFASQDLPTLTFILRVFSLLIGSLSVFAAYHAAKLFYTEPSRRLCVPLLIALLPMFFSTVARISNDSLGVFLFSLLVLLVLKYIRSGGAGKHAIFIGVVTGLGLLTKAYFLTALPVIAIVIIMVGLKQKTLRGTIGRIAWVGCFVFVIPGWWYARNYLQYGNISGLFVMISAAPISLKDQVAHIFKISWLSTLNLVFREQIWTCNSSFISLSKMIYRAAYLLTGLAILGLLRIYVPVAGKFFSLLKSKSRLANIEDARSYRPGPDRSAVSVMILFYAFLVLGMMYQVHQTFGITGQIATGGWYLYAVIIPGVLLLCCGLEALLGSGAKRLVPSILLICALILNFLGNFCKAIPYYAGFAIPRFHVGDFFKVYSADGIRQILLQLSINKSFFVTPAAVGACIGFYLVLLILVVGLWSKMRRSNSNEISVHP